MLTRVLAWQMSEDGKKEAVRDDKENVHAANTIWSDIRAMELLPAAQAMLVDLDVKGNSGELRETYLLAALVDSYSLHFCHFYRAFTRETPATCCNVNLRSHVTAADWAAFACSEAFKTFVAHAGPFEAVAAEHLRMGGKKTKSFPAELGVLARSILDAYLALPSAAAIRAVPAPDHPVSFCLPPTT